MNRQFLLALAASLILATLMSSVPFAFSNGRPTIMSRWTSTPPTIDGVFQSGEWTNLQITFASPEYPSSYVLPTYVYFVNDGSNLYVLVDAVGDTHDDPTDQCLLVFGFGTLVPIRIIGSSGVHQAGPPFTAAIGYQGSPNDAASHKIYEFSIPFSYINSSPGEPLTFSSPPWKSVSTPYDAFNAHDNVWPLGWTQDDINTYGQLDTQAGPVGGTTLPLDQIQVLLPWFTLIVALSFVSAEMLMFDRRKSRGRKND